MVLAAGHKEPAPITSECDIEAAIEAPRKTDTISTPFLKVPSTWPSSKDYLRIMLFVTAYLITILVLLSAFWVPRGGDSWSVRLIFVATVIIEAFSRFAMASWWFKAASLKLALAFAESEFISLSLVGVSCLFVEPLLNVSSIPGSLILATFTETLKVICFLVPFGLRQVTCESHVLFISATSGLLNILYHDMFTGFPRELYPLWQSVVMSILQATLFVLWPMMGAAIFCQVKRGRIGLKFSPLVILAPVLFHFGYLVAVGGWSMNDWQWSAITLGYAIGSGVALRLVMDNQSSANFVKGTTTV